MVQAVLLAFGLDHQEEGGGTGKLSTPRMRLRTWEEGRGREGNRKWGQWERNRGRTPGWKESREREKHFSLPFR